MAALYAEGLSLREIGRRLLYEGYFPPGGGPWPAKTLSDMLKSTSPPASLTASLSA